MVIEDDSPAIRSQATAEIFFLRPAAPSLNLRFGPEGHELRAPGPGRKAGSRCSRSRFVGVILFTGTAAAG
jgi:hypothetical protein